MFNQLEGDLAALVISLIQQFLVKPATSLCLPALPCPLQEEEQQHQQQQGEPRATDGAPQASLGAAADAEAQLRLLIRRFCAHVPSRAQQSPAPSAGAPTAPVSTSGKRKLPTASSIIEQHTGGRLVI